MTDIILIGPIGAGKTTVGRLLAEKLNLPVCSIDDVRDEYYEKAGYNKFLAEQIAATDGIWGVLRNSKPYEALLVERILADHHGVIDFGASNTVHDDENLFTRVKTALASFPNVVLLIPSPDAEESIGILKKRLIQMLANKGREYSDELFKLNEYFIRHPSNHSLAKMVIYTGDKTPRQVRDEVIEKLQLK